MANGSTYGAPPERLRRLLMFGRDDPDEDDQPTASWDMLNEKTGSQIGRYRLVRLIGEGGIEHVRKMIREADPKTPSKRLTKLGEKAAAIAENRRMEIQTLAKHLRKELEWILLKAIRKERSERYRSASELADDIEDYLADRPLIAGPLTSSYRLRKFLWRHKALVGGVAAVLVVSVIGAIVSLSFALGQARALLRRSPSMIISGRMYLV